MYSTYLKCDLLALPHSCTNLFSMGGSVLPLLHEEMSPPHYQKEAQRLKNIRCKLRMIDLLKCRLLQGVPINMGIQ